jgi:hypothetical protein
MRIQRGTCVTYRNARSLSYIRHDERCGIPVSKITSSKNNNAVISHLAIKRATFSKKFLVVLFDELEAGLFFF